MNEELLDKLSAGDFSEMDVNLDAVEGLGRILRRPKINPRQVKTALKRTIQRPGNRKPLLEQQASSGQKLIIAKKNELKVDDRNDAERGNLKFGTNILYISREIASLTGIVNVYDSSFKNGSGFSNLDENAKIPSGINMAVDYIAIGFTSYLTASEFLNSNNFAFLPGTTHKKLTHAEFELLIDDETRLRIPLLNFIEPRKRSRSNNVYPLNSGYNLNSKIFVKSGQRINARIYMPDGVTYSVASSNVGIRLFLFGDSTRKN